MQFLIQQNNWHGNIFRWESTASKSLFLYLKKSTDPNLFMWLVSWSTTNKWTVVEAWLITQERQNSAIFFNHFCQILNKLTWSLWL